MFDDKAKKAMHALKRHYGHMYSSREGIDEATEVSEALVWFCNWGFTHHEELRSDLKTLRMLLDAGADVHHDHDLALYLMVEHAYHLLRPRPPVQELLEHGADMFATGIDRYTKKPRLSALEYAAERNREQPDNVQGILSQFAEPWRDWLVETSSGDKHYPEGTHVLDQYPALAKKLATAIGTEDYKYVADVVATSMQLLSALALPLTPENMLELITPKDSQTFRQLAESTRCYDNAKCQSAVDMFRDVESSLIIPAAVLLSQGNTRKTLLNNYDQVIGYYNQKRFSDLHERFRKLSIKVVMKGKNVEDILGLSEAWHSPRYEMPTELKPMLGAGRWHALAEDISLPSGYTIVCRTSGKQLQAESVALNHCVGRSSTYASACLTGRTHILSVIDAEGFPVSTIQIDLEDTGNSGTETIRIPGDKRHLSIIQHRGIGNGTPPPLAETALADWKRRVENGTLALNLTQLGETTACKANKLKACTALEAKLGFLITPEHVEQLFRHYRGTPENKGLRGLIYNPENGAIADNRRNHLINGQYHAVDGYGKKTGLSVKREDLTFRQWLDVTGAKEEISATLKEHENDLEQTWWRGWDK